MEELRRLANGQEGIACGFAALVCGLLLLAGPASAYPQYSLSGDATYCASCHGDFRSNNYISPSDGANWGNSLHVVHRSYMLASDCSTCHGPFMFPVQLDSSNGGLGLAAISCVGCHGREEDEADPNAGYGAGLRQHHANAGIADCQGCHTDADPANYTPVAEHVLPPYYSDADINHPDMPSDPCNLAADGHPEDYAGSVRGLDNDGDLLWDEDDPDCPPPIGEAATALNVDFGLFYGAPVAGYGGASGQAGSWNRVGLGASALVDIAGDPSGVTLDLSALTDGGNTGFTPTNDDELLLYDNFFQSGSTTWLADLGGVTPGSYLVFLYAPSNGAVSSGQMTVNGVGVDSIPGDTSGALIEGTSWVSVAVEVTDGTLAISGEGAGASGLAGLQLVPLRAPTLNVDFGVSYGTPAATYGAASGEAGSWNLVGLGATALVDIAGDPSGVTLDLSASTDGGNTGFTPTNDDELLLYDNFFRSSGATWLADLGGLAPGSYRVYLYAPSNGAVSSGQMTVNGVNVDSIPGDSGGALIEGTSWVSVAVAVTNGTLAISGQGASASGLAGLQVVPLPEPGTASALASGAALLALLFAHRRGRRAAA